MFEHRQIIVFEGKYRRSRLLANVQRLTAPRIIDQFGPKDAQRCKLTISISICSKYFVVHDLWAGKYSFSIYVCYTLDVLLWWALYVEFSKVSISRLATLNVVNSEGT